jgi:hypothetical protein
MATSAKAPSRKNLPRRKPRTATKSPRVQRQSLADDVAARRKIGQTLDISAFASHHQKNSMSSKYWETKE